MVKPLPLLPISREVFERLPRAEEQPKGFAKYCPLGFMYRATDKELGREFIGHVVASDYALVDQVGGGMLSLGERFINKYIPIFLPLLLRHKL